MTWPLSPGEALVLGVLLIVCGWIATRTGVIDPGCGNEDRMYDDDSASILRGPRPPRPPITREDDPMKFYYITVGAYVCGAILIVAGAAGMLAG